MIIIECVTQKGGRCKVLLPRGETVEQVKLRLMQLGFFNFVVKQKGAK